MNCGECLAVCPIYQWSAIRLPQTLVHWGERLQAGHRPITSLSDLLDICMRCGNCEEVCQAGIQHLDLYAAMDTQIDGSRVADQARNGRHVDMLTAIRGSQRYRGRFLHVRPGIYLRRSPAALSGIVAAFILAISRAIGETMAVSIAAGSTPNMTLNPLKSVQTLTAFIVQVSFGDAAAGSINSQSIYAVGMTLFVMTFVMNLISDLVLRKFREVYE